MTKQDDLIERLTREAAAWEQPYGAGPLKNLLREAAAELTRLREENEAARATFEDEQAAHQDTLRLLTRLREERDGLRDTLKPFAGLAAVVASERPGWDHDAFEFKIGDTLFFTLKPFRAARAALNAADHSKPQ